MRAFLSLVSFMSDSSFLLKKVAICLISLCLSLLIWQSHGILKFPTHLRQHNSKLITQVDMLKKHLTKDDSVYIVVQNGGGNWGYYSYVFRYALLPFKTLNLPHRWLSADDPNTNFRTRHFKNPLELAQFLKQFPITHLLITSGDSIAQTSLGLPLNKERMYLIRFEPNTMKFLKLDEVSIN